jgi:hypothetical protein
MRVLRWIAGQRARAGASAMASSAPVGNAKSILTPSLARKVKYGFNKQTRRNRFYQSAGEHAAIGYIDAIGAVPSKLEINSAFEVAVDSGRISQRLAGSVVPGKLRPPTPEGRAFAAGFLRHDRYPPGEEERWRRIMIGLRRQARRWRNPADKAKFSKIDALAQRPGTPGEQQAARWAAYRFVQQRREPRKKP